VRVKTQTRKKTQQNEKETGTTQSKKISLDDRDDNPYRRKGDNRNSDGRKKN